MRFTQPIERRQRAGDALDRPDPVELTHTTRVPRGAWTKRSLPADGGSAREGAAGVGRLAVRAEMGRLQGVLENDGDELALWSRNGRPLLRYFPELRPLGDLLPPHSALDGEIVIARDGVLDFDSMQMRLHPAESRVRKLSAEIPAEFIVFDLLLWKGKPVHEQPLEERRAELEQVAKGFHLSPTHRATRPGAQKWLDSFEAAGLDGVIAKKLGLPVPARLARRRHSR